MCAAPPDHPYEWPPVQARAGEAYDEETDTLTTTVNDGKPWTRFDDNSVSAGSTCRWLLRIHMLLFTAAVSAQDRRRGAGSLKDRRNPEGSGQRHAYILFYVLNEQKLLESHQSALRAAYGTAKAKAAKTKSKKAATAKK